MNKLHKTLLLLGLQAQCRADREQDWHNLHRRDREWFQDQSLHDRWQLAHRWLQHFAGPQPWSPALSPLLVLLAGLLLGVGLMSGLLQFQPQQRINLWWWLLLAVWLPLLWWIVGLFLGRSAGSGLWVQALLRRLPPGWRDGADVPLLGLTARAVAQQFSFGFGLGLLTAFFAYLVLTDLAFGWSSTLDFSATDVHGLTQVLSLPWQSLWPDAVPSLALIEHTRFFRVDASVPASAAELGQWWRFLLMNLLLYVLLPRLSSLCWAEWRLWRAQQRLFAQDACIDGWWQRLHTEQVRQQASPAPRNRAPDNGIATVGHAPPDTSAAWPLLHAMLVGGHWQPQRLTDAIEKLPAALRSLPRLTVAQATTADDQAYLLLCKGWEPPTGALADLCRQLHQQRHRLYLWPAPLPGMKRQRASQLRESWRLFLPQLPASCQLLEPGSDD